MLAVVHGLGGWPKEVASGSGDSAIPLATIDWKNGFMIIALH